MRLRHGFAALAMMASASMAHAELTGTVTAISDYDLRGITQSAGDPALQASIDWTGENGLYLSAWGSNIDFGDCCDEEIEIDIFGGLRGGDAVTWDLGFIYYAYPGTDPDLDYPEIYAAVGWEWLSGKVSYSNDYAATDETAFYYEANGNWSLPSDFGLAAHVGYSDGDAIAVAYGGGEDNYIDWSVGVTYPLANFTLGLKYVDGSDLESRDGTPGDVLSSEARAIFWVSTTFPWSNE
jgi:uncharacterized protein (TIGR02001 family)